VVGYIMQCYVGTSGWLYDWNKAGSLDWYIENSGLNAIELNASFYRFPFPNQVKSWAAKGADLAWSVKVNRLITHVHMLNEKSINLFENFLELFKPLDNYISFYLFQMPPKFDSTLASRLEEFARLFNAQKFAVEFRNESWYNYDFSKLDFKGSVVSLDSPEVRKIWAGNGIIYMRFHGRREWYSYAYSKAELKSIADELFVLKPKNVFAFFNNDHNMLENAREFYSEIKKAK
ncbi:MAG: DUF72 domain-containing protein, partial [Candidatus Micrarchaeaceae archaeon]